MLQNFLPFREILVQQVDKAVNATTYPFQYSLKTEMSVFIIRKMSGKTAEKCRKKCM